MLLGRPLMASRFWEEGVMDGDNTSNKNRDRGGRGQTIWDAICGRPLKEKTYSIRKALLRSKLCISIYLIWKCESSSFGCSLQVVG